MSISQHGLSRAQFEAMRSRLPPHLVPCFEAMLFGAGLLVVAQSTAPFRLPTRRPTVILVGDDTDRSLGPDGFHASSVNRAIRSAGSVAVIACAPVPAAYAGPVRRAVSTRRNAVVIETRPEHEIPWIKLVQRLAPEVPLLVASVEGGRA
jgi:hypothetical protein